MEGLAKMTHENYVFTVNGMHQWSGTYNGFGEFSSKVLATIPDTFDNFKMEPVNMICEGNIVCFQAKIMDDNMRADVMHMWTVENDLVTSFLDFDDSQKMAHAMKAM